MTKVGWQDALFSAKTFAAAMLALFLAFAADLPQPSWAMTTVFVVSQPLAGMVIAKSVFRVAGTIGGAAASLALVGAFAQAGEAFVAALALWIGACTFVAVLLRDAPASYGALLSGYSAAIVGVPAALAPETAFDTAAARCIEITLGIACATSMAHLVLPRRADAAMARAAEACVAALGRWAADTLRGQDETDRGLADRRMLVGDVIALDALRIFARYEGPHARIAVETARHLQGRLLRLLSVLVSLHDRVVLLRRLALPFEARLLPLRERIADLIDRSAEGDLTPEDEAAVAAIRAEIAAGLPGYGRMVAEPGAILEQNILLRLDGVLAAWSEVAEARRHLRAGRPLAAAEPAPSRTRYRDPKLALAAAAVSVGAILAAAAFWFATAWPNGSSAVVFAGVVSSLLGALDDPAAAATGFLRMTVLAVGAAALYLFGILPLVTDFPGLAAVLLPFFVAFGMILALPRIGTQILPLGLNTAALLGLTNARAQPDFAAYLNGALGLVAGIGAALAAFRLLRPLGTEGAVRRLRQGILLDLERVMRPGTPAARAPFETRMLDRAGALLTRLDVDREADLRAFQGTLAALRIGLNGLALKRLRDGLPPEVAGAVDGALAALADRLRRLAAGRGGEAEVPELDRATEALVAAGPCEGAAETLLALAAIASALHRHPDFFGIVRSSLVPDILRPAAP